MKQKLFSLMFAIVASIGTMFAWDYEHVKIGDLYYNLNATDQTAEVTSGTCLATADIPSSVTYNSVTYSVTSIGERAFNNCSDLTSVTIPNSVTSIGNSAFLGCSGLTSVTIPNSVTSIGEYAFLYCSGLTSVTIPNSVTSIGGLTFSRCISLTSVTIPNSVTSIGRDAFWACSGLTSVTIPNSVTSIGNSAFEYCSSLTSVTIPNSVTSIGENAFGYCTGLTSVMIPNSVTSIGVNAFGACSGLTTMFVEAGNTIYDSRDNCNAIIETASNTLVAGCKNTIIPNSVTSIGNHAFDNCGGLTSVTIPNSVISIGNNAFSYCSLISVTIPNSVTSIGNYAFQSCSSLTSVSIPNSVTSIGDYAFCYCCSLTSIEIPNSVTSIGEYAFYGCSGLTSVTIPNSVTSIGEYAFQDCSSLTSVTIPSSVTSIEDWAFAGCSSLTSITCEAVNPPALENNVFSSVEKSIPLYVPAEGIAAYQAAEQWSEFTNIQPIHAASVVITANEDPQHAGTYYSTFYYSSGNYELPATGVEAFVATISGSDMNLTRIAGGAGVIPQGTAVILRSTIASYNLTLSDDAAAFDGNNVLQGVDAATTTPANCYVLSAVDGVIGFYQYTGAQVGAHKAYVIYSGVQGSAPRRMRFVFDEENAATGVEGVQSTDSSADGVQKRIENGQLIIQTNDVRYNAQGMIVK